MQKLYTVQDLCKLFSKHVNTIRTWIEDGVFPHAFKVKDGWYVPERDVRALMKASQIGQAMPGLETRPNMRRNAPNSFVTRWKT
jgi:hypothetical protein